MLLSSTTLTESFEFELDPTVEFQNCPCCVGVPVLFVRRYQCRDCDSDIRSKFLFEGLVFYAEYFKEKMSEIRQRKKKQLEQIKQMLAENRSNALALGPGQI